MVTIPIYSNLNPYMDYSDSGMHHLHWGYHRIFVGNSTLQEFNHIKQAQKGVLLLQSGGAGHHDDEFAWSILSI